MAEEGEDPDGTAQASKNSAGTLSTDTLASLSKLNRDTFIHSFIKEQRPFHQLFAKEGNSYFQTWSTGSSRSIVRSDEGKKRSVLGLPPGTPVLKPRNPNLPKAADRPGASILTKGAEEHPSKTQKRKAATPVEEPTIAKSVTRKADSRTDKQGPSTRRKRPASNASHDTDAEDRLKQRKERKRVKREIVKPKDDSEAGKKKAKKGRSVPAGLALMHGFQATNVGKTRLTTPVSLGVFRKGKASGKTNVGRKKGKPERREACFSELAFLQNNAPQKATSSVAGRSSSSQYIHEAKETRKKNQRKSNRRPAKAPSSQADSHTGSLVVSTEGDGDVQQNNEDKSSVVYSASWIIDPAEFPQSPGQSTVSAPNQDSAKSAHDQGSAHPAPMHCDSVVTGSVLLNTRGLLWADQVTPVVSSPVKERARKANGSHVSSSIMPSDSASQLPAPTVPNTQRTSKYFQAVSVQKPVEASSNDKPYRVASALSAGVSHCASQSLQAPIFPTVVNTRSPTIALPSAPPSTNSSLNTVDYRHQRDLSNMVDDMSPIASSRFMVAEEVAELDTQLEYIPYVDDDMTYSSADEEMAPYSDSPILYQEPSDACSCSSCDDECTCLEDCQSQEEVPATELLSSSTGISEDEGQYEAYYPIDAPSPWDNYSRTNNFNPANTAWTAREESEYQGDYFSDALSATSGAHELMFEDDDAYTVGSNYAEDASEHSSLGGFVEGRQLLRHEATSTPMVPRSGLGFLGISQVEEMVARDLRSHWLPQRR